MGVSYAMWYPPARFGQNYKYGKVRAIIIRQDLYKINKLRGNLPAGFRQRCDFLAKSRQVPVHVVV